MLSKQGLVIPSNYFNINGLKKSLVVKKLVFVCKIYILVY